MALPSNLAVTHGHLRGTVNSNSHVCYIVTNTRFQHPFSDVFLFVEVLGAMIENFGICPENQTVSRVRLSGHEHGTYSDMGGGARDLRLERYSDPLVVGFETLRDYIDHSQYHGVTAGRVINQIGGAKATIKGKQHSLDANQDGRHMLHGGVYGYGTRHWQILECSDPRFRSVLLTRTAPEFPGTVTAACRYSLVEGPALKWNSPPAPTFQRW